MKRWSLLPLLFVLLGGDLFAQFVSTTNTGLGTLMSLAVDPAGNRYVSDRSQNRVIKLDNNNTPTTHCGSGLADPQDLERGPGGELYVVNNANGTVAVVPPGGGAAVVYASGFSSPRGVTLAPNGDLYVAEYMTQQIYRVAPGGGAVGGPNVTQIVGVAGITGALGGSDRLEDISWEPSGSLVATIGFGNPGRIYRIALPSGAATLLASSPLITAAFALNVNQQTGNIYVTAIYSHRIFSLTPSGTLSLLAGDGTAATLDGPLASARFNEPAGIAVDPVGNIWITQYNGDVRRIGLQPAEVPTNGLRLWLRADRGLLRNGSTVTQWLDQSGSANHATPTGTLFTPQPPAFVSNVVNGYPAVRFNGVNTGLTTPAFQTFPNKRGTIFSVVRVNAPSSTSGGGFGSIAGTYYASSGTQWQYGTNFSTYTYYDGVGLSGFNVASNPPATWGIATFVRNADNGYQFYKSGIPAGSGPLANNQPSALPVHIGWNDYPSTSLWEVLNGDIAEVLIYDFALTPAEMEQVNAYLADKYFFNGDVPLPTAQGATVCGSGSVTLTASGGDAYRWYDSPDATVPLATTSSFITPVLTSTTTYYVANFNGQLQSQRVAVTVSVLTPGASCDDGDAGTVNDVLSAQCQCAGTPVITCNTDLVLEFDTDANAAQISWELRASGSGDLMQSGSGLPGPVNSLTVNTCLPDGCYYLRVLDSGGDGIANGGYMLRTLVGAQRIIDNRDNFTTGSVSAVIGNGGFCLPLGTDRLIFTSCDKLDWVNNQFIVAAPNPAVSAQFGVSNANSGYQFWWFDPNGTYGYTKFRSHATSDGFGTGATRACHARINNWSPNQIPANVLMNVKVRGRVNGTNLPWGPVCRFMIDPVRAACPLTKLMDIPGNVNFSCGVTRTWGSGPSGRLTARPVDGATQYQFRFLNGELPEALVRTSGSYSLQLNWTPALPNGTYQVQVRAFKNGGWCVTSLPWGDVCNVTITGSPNAMVLDGGSATSTGDVKLALFPNPNNGDQLTVSLSAVEEGVGTIAVDIFDLNGARVSAQVLAVNDGMVYQVVDVAGLADGLYMVNITAGGQRYTERLVIAK